MIVTHCPPLSCSLPVRISAEQHSCDASSGSHARDSRIDHPYGAGGTSLGNQPSALRVHRLRRADETKIGHRLPCPRQGVAEAKEDPREQTHRSTREPPDRHHSEDRIRLPNVINWSSPANTAGDPSSRPGGPPRHPGSPPDFAVTDLVGRRFEDKRTGTGPVDGGKPTTRRSPRLYTGSG